MAMCNLVRKEAFFIKAIYIESPNPDHFAIHNIITTHQMPHEYCFYFAEYRTSPIRLKVSNTRYFYIEDFEKAIELIYADFYSQVENNPKFHNGFSISIMPASSVLYIGQC